MTESETSITRSRRMTQDEATALVKFFGDISGGKLSPTTLECSVRITESTDVHIFNVTAHGWFDDNIQIDGQRRRIRSLNIYCAGDDVSARLEFYPTEAVH